MSIPYLLSRLPHVDCQFEADALLDLIDCERDAIDARIKAMHCHKFDLLLAADTEEELDDLEACLRAAERQIERLEAARDVLSAGPYDAEAEVTRH